MIHTIGKDLDIANKKKAGTTTNIQIIFKNGTRPGDAVCY